MNKLTTCAAMAVVTAALALAQGSGTHKPNGPPDPQTMIQMRVSFLASMLNLTDDQKSQATSIFTNSFNAGQAAHSAMHTARQSLADAVKKNDTATIDQLSASIGTLSGQLTAIEAKADAALYAILTTDQQTKYDNMPHGGLGGPGPAGFGRAGGFGPPPR